MVEGERVRLRLAPRLGKGKRNRGMRCAALGTVAGADNQPLQCESDESTGARRGGGKRARGRDRGRRRRRRSQEAALGGNDEHCDGDGNRDDRRQ